MKSKEFVSNLEEYRECVRSVSTLNRYQIGIIIFDAFIRISLIFNHFLIGDTSVILHIATLSCIVQTVSSLIYSFFHDSYQEDIKGKLHMFFYDILKLFQVDFIYILETKKLQLNLKNNRLFVQFYKEDCQHLLIWIQERKIFTVFRMMLFLGEMQKKNISFFLFIGVIYSLISIFNLNYIHFRAFYINCQYDLRERLFIKLEIICQCIQSFINAYFLMSYSHHLLIYSFFGFYYLLQFYLQVKHKSYLMSCQVGIMEYFLFGQKMWFVNTLLKKDMKQFNLVTSSYINLVLFILYSIIQLTTIKHLLLDDHKSPKILKILQIKILAINFILMVVKSYLLRNLMKSWQIYQAEDIIMTEQYKKKDMLRVYVLIKSEQQLYIQEEDQQALERILSSPIEEFYICFENEFEIFNKKGNMYLKINSIRHQPEIEKVYLAILNSCKTINFEYDKDLISLPKIDKFMYLLLRNCIFENELKMITTKAEILQYFEKQEIDFSTYVKKFSSLCREKIYLTAYYKYYNNYFKIDAFVILTDIQNS